MTDWISAVLFLGIILMAFYLGLQAGWAHWVPGKWDHGKRRVIAGGKTYYVIAVSPDNILELEAVAPADP